MSVQEGRQEQMEEWRTYEQICLEPLDLHDVLLDERPLGHPLVNLGLVLDPRRPGGVVDRGQRLLEVRPRRRDGGDDPRLGLSSERVLQQSSKFGLSVA